MKLSKQQFKYLFGTIFLGSFMFLMPEVYAGTGGSEFNSIYSTITGWMQGTLGKLITIALLITGIGFGVVQQSVVAAVPAIAAGLILNAAPGVIDGIVTAVL
ncbi:MAG: pili assembly chaperone [Methylococcales bacterium]|jgi:conjugal transfer pilus assembly protein TraA|nr:pili assembly chaperone [Methylococcales bacterium]